MRGEIVTAATISEAEWQTPCCSSPCSLANPHLVLEQKSGPLEYSSELLVRRHSLLTRGPSTCYHHVQPTALIIFQQVALGVPAHAWFITALGSSLFPFPGWWLLSHCHASDPSSTFQPEDLGSVFAPFATSPGRKQSVLCLICTSEDFLYVYI